MALTSRFSDGGALRNEKHAKTTIDTNQSGDIRSGERITPAHVTRRATYGSSDSFELDDRESVHIVARCESLIACRRFLMLAFECHDDQILP